VAHDFNNLLSAILGRTQLLLRGGPDEETRRQLEVIERAALDGAQTVRRVQEFTRVRQDERIETVDLAAIAADAVELTRPAWDSGAQKRGVPIELLLDLRARRTVAGSGSELREVLTNLILNAVDAMPEGGTLMVSSEEGPGRVRLCVRDTGIGMDEATRSRVFEPFFTTKSSRGGGLGLSVAYGIVQRHKGTLEVHSEPGRGSLFTITLPVANGEVNAPPPVPEAKGSAPLEVLVVDDERVVLDVLAEMLRSLGHRVTPALGGHAACEALRKGRYDVVFSDLGMPDVTGWDVAAEARREDHARAFVLVSGWGHQLEPAEVAERGVDRVLPKPFSLDEVREAIGGLFQGERRSA
jgi:CheY-like chemotaxis protein/anti-sigma regulatory factor (Ser/Thr protein kinase)